MNLIHRDGNPAAPTAPTPGLSRSMGSDKGNINPGSVVVCSSARGSATPVDVGTAPDRPASDGTSRVSV